jgi:hypothetical protein
MGEQKLRLFPLWKQQAPSSLFVANPEVSPPQLDLFEVRWQVVLECLKATQMLRAATVLRAKLEDFLSNSVR